MNVSLQENEDASRTLWVCCSFEWTVTERWIGKDMAEIGRSRSEDVYGICLEVLTKTAIILFRKTGLMTSNLTRNILNEKLDLQTLQCDFGSLDVSWTACQWRQASFSVVSVNIYQSTRRPFSEHFSIHYRYCDNLRPFRYKNAGFFNDMLMKRPRYSQWIWRSVVTV
jgi:hypothetical protein